MKLKAIIRRMHKYITGGTRYHCAARRWCPSVDLIRDKPTEKMHWYWRNCQRLLRIGGVNNASEGAGDK